MDDGDDVIFELVQLEVTHSWLSALTRETFILASNLSVREVKLEVIAQSAIIATHFRKLEFDISTAAAAASNNSSSSSSSSSGFNPAAANASSAAGSSVAAGGSAAHTTSSPADTGSSSTASTTTTTTMPGAASDALCNALVFAFAGRELPIAQEASLRFVAIDPSIPDAVSNCATIYISLRRRTDPAVVAAAVSAGPTRSALLLQPLKDQQQQQMQTPTLRPSTTSTATSSGTAANAGASSPQMNRARTTHQGSAAATAAGQQQQQPDADQAGPLPMILLRQSPAEPATGDTIAETRRRLCSAPAPSSFGAGAGIERLPVRICFSTDCELLIPCGDGAVLLGDFVLSAVGGLVATGLLQLAPAAAEALAKAAPASTTTTTTTTGAKTSTSYASGLYSSILKQLAVTADDGTTLAVDEPLGMLPYLQHCLKSKELAHLAVTFESLVSRDDEDFESEGEEEEEPANNNDDAASYYDDVEPILGDASPLIEEENAYAVMPLKRGAAAAASNGAAAPAAAATTSSAPPPIPTAPKPVSSTGPASPAPGPQESLYAALRPGARDLSGMSNDLYSALSPPVPALPPRRNTMTANTTAHAGNHPSHQGVVQAPGAPPLPSRDKHMSDSQSLIKSLQADRRSMAVHVSSSSSTSSSHDQRASLHSGNRTNGSAVTEPMMRSQSVSSTGKARGRSGRNRRPMSRANTIRSKQIFPIEFVFPSGQSLLVPCPGSYNIERVKSLVWTRVFEYNATVQHSQPIDVGILDNCALKYVMQNQLYELFDEQQLLQTLQIIKHWLSSGEKQQLFVASRTVELGKREKRLNMKIGELIGYGLHQFTQQHNPELDLIRRRFVCVRRAAVDQRDFYAYMLDCNTTSAKVPQNLVTKMIDNKLKIKVFFSQGTSKTLIFDAYSRPTDLLESLVTEKSIKVLNLPSDSKPGHYILKMRGMEDYLDGDNSLISFKQIRRCVLKGEPIELTVIERVKLNFEDEANLMEEFDLIDDSIGVTGTHEQLSAKIRDHTQITTQSLWDISRRFRIRITGADRLVHGNVRSLYVEAAIYHGGQLCASPLKTDQVPITAAPRWREWLTFDIETSNLPRAARICFTVYGRWNAKKNMSDDKEHDIHPLGWVNFLLMDYKGYLRSGHFTLALWPEDKANPIGTTMPNPAGNESGTLSIELDTFQHAIAFPHDLYMNEYKNLNMPMPTDEHDHQRLEQIINSDPLFRLDSRDEKLVWMYRHYCMRRPEALPKFLLAVKWNRREHVQEAHKCLLAWAALSPEAALELLDANFADERVRAYAVSRLELLPNDELGDYLLQLVQVLKYEPYHDSALARFLLRRALLNRRIGHSFFWYLRAEVRTPDIAQRFGLLLEAFTRGCGTPMMNELVHEHQALDTFVKVANFIKGAKSSVERKEMLRQQLEKVQLPEQFSLAYDPNIHVGSLRLESCKYFDSKKLPLRLVLDNSDPASPPVYVIFKSGDDLRQDMLTLQMLRIMDNLWQQNSLDLRMNPYGCISTGHEVGMIEVVLNAETVAKIQQQYGGSMAAFKDETLHNWLRQQNPTDADFNRAVETFTLSCAGYCVATYVLGIGDRHNDNIMVTKSGHLFHIDFGHFLGNIKRKFGIKRERAPFVLTPDFVYVMGKREGFQFQKFQEYCCQAFLALRRKANMFINLFAMMLSTGIPELKSADDINYLRDALCLGKTEEEAAKEFKNLIFECLRLSWSTQLNWWIHNIAHS
ncbi:phosphoinositide-3-kinase gamma catalytic subunit [Capsaspora owczarzaki ATCC 30864]|uniref:Atypical/PI3K/PI4K protein kinase n=1 Tax=Capsaspora owczarzaki (strain ATCC 30864) TaxID=595528 RepID=A0A0D2VR19_CAPO3|nr:phosphoinositide-3-kinase gamma catalytic subunit [Capsaspora owczarzaki ATCC 30864]KJE93282.1 Atypical/PI3K/PI4K protein kinase [Capsaspora owczarzaki ATCC 30864]|eukprot:XP_004347915.1 phosphoinositide-3-kinase gamma catalytic subunit [Capsaspora owczarzaki ATCC 30864]